MAGAESSSVQPAMFPAFKRPSPPGPPRASPSLGDLCARGCRDVQLGVLYPSGDRAGLEPTSTSCPVPSVHSPFVGRNDPKVGVPGRTRCRLLRPRCRRAVCSRVHPPPRPRRCPCPPGRSGASPSGPRRQTAGRALESCWPRGAHSRHDYHWADYFLFCNRPARRANKSVEPRSDSRAPSWKRDTRTFGPELAARA